MGEGGRTITFKSLSSDLYSDPPFRIPLWGTVIEICLNGELDVFIAGTNGLPEAAGPPQRPRRRGCRARGKSSRRRRLLRACRMIADFSTAVFLIKAPATSDRESGTILNWLGAEVCERIVSGSLCVVFAHRDPNTLNTKLLTTKMTVKPLSREITYKGKSLVQGNLLQREIP